MSYRADRHKKRKKKQHAAQHNTFPEFLPDGKDCLATMNRPDGAGVLPGLIFEISVQCFEIWIDFPGKSFDPIHTKF